MLFRVPRDWLRMFTDRFRFRFSGDLVLWSDRVDVSSYRDHFSK